MFLLCVGARHREGPGTTPVRPQRVSNPDPPILIKPTKGKEKQLLWWGCGSYDRPQITYFVSDRAPCCSAHHHTPSHHPTIPPSHPMLRPHHPGDPSARLSPLPSGPPCPTLTGTSPGGPGVRSAAAHEALTVGPTTCGTENRDPKSLTPPTP